MHTLADAAGEHRPPVYVLGTCGLRFGEVAELRWRDVDLEGLRLRVARSVTLIDGQLVIGLPKSAHHASGPRPVAAAELFPRTVDGEIVHEFKLDKLRHTAASLAIQAAANISARQNMLGHESARLTLDR
ncbi:MAG: hypothetical protein JWR46_3070 [Mycobacterium sp.]|nr:hypothetical protein [Mycobacterium sp.]